jgi:PST family polysaccharide transporter
VYGIKGIPFYILILGSTLLISTWYYAKRLNIKFKIPELKIFTKEFKKLINIGLGFSIAAAIGAIITYLSRIYISDEFDLSSVGIYQACWMMSNIYIGMILRAMGVDFMPRLSKVIKNKVKTNQLVNEQMELGLLVSGIGIIGVLIYSPIALELLYSKEFTAGVSIIQWQILGVSLRVLGFPFSYVIILRGKSITYVIVQVIFWVSDYLLLILFSSLIGFDGLGINFFVSYLIYLTITWIINYKIIEFRPSKLLIVLMSKVYLFILATLITSLFLPNTYTYLVGILFVIYYLIWMVSRLKNDMQIDIINILNPANITIKYI